MSKGKPTLIQSTARNSYLFIFALIFILGIFLRISHYTSKAMWGDEIFVLIVAKRSFIDIVRVLYNDIHQPLYYFIVKVLSYFSRSDIVRKLPSLLSGIATLVVFFHISRRFTDIKVALVGTLLLSWNVEHIRYSQMLRMYTMVTLFSLISTYALYRFLESKGDRKMTWLYIISTALAFHTQITAAVVFIFQLLYIVYCLVDSFVIRMFNKLKEYATKNTLDCLYLLLFLISGLIFICGKSILSNNVSPAGVIIAKKYTYLSGILLFLGGSFLASLVSVRFFYKEKSLEPLINLPIVKRGLLMGLLLIVVSPIFIYCLLGSILSFYAHRPMQTWIPLSLKQLAVIFQFNLTGQAPGRILTIPRESFYCLVLFPLGIILAFLRGKRWVALFTLHVISLFIYIIIVGYSKEGIALGNRHFLLTLPPAIMFVSIGLVWGLEFIYRFFARVISFLFRITRFDHNVNILPSHRRLLDKIFLNVFVIVFTALFLMKDAPAAYTNVRWWYEQKWDDWHTFGKFLNAKLKPGILIFFTDQCFQWQVSVNTDKRTEDLIFHTRNSSLDKRAVWQAVYNYEKFLQELINNGFKPILTVHPGVTHILEKNFNVQSPLVITKQDNGLWEHTAVFKDYKFVSYFDSIENLCVRRSSLGPTICGEPCSITYHFKVQGSKKFDSFIINSKFEIGEASFAKLKLSWNGKDFTDIAFIDKGGSYQFDITDQIGGASSFYVRFELFAKWLPTYLFDAMESIFLDDLKFQASLL